jgi:hypothetical protein
MRHFALLVLLALLVPAAGRAADPAPSRPSGPPLGIGEPRAPERYTLSCACRPRATATVD